MSAGYEPGTNVVKLPRAAKHRRDGAKNFCDRISDDKLFYTLACATVGPQRSGERKKKEKVKNNNNNNKTRARRAKLFRRQTAAAAEEARAGTTTC